MSVNKDLNDVTDSSDWDGTQVPYMAQLDSLQRCFICKEFLQAPVMTSCNHTFCSKCIRQHLLNNSSCPLCKSEQYESNLRRVVVLEEIVNCFKTLRPVLLGYLAKHGQLTPDTSSDITDKIDISPKRKDDDIEIISSSPVKRQKLEAECPICQKYMDPEFLQSTHIDSCLKGKSILPPKTLKPKPKTISSFFKQKTPKSPDLSVDHRDFYFNNPNKHTQAQNRLPKLDFNSLTTPKLKEKLSAVNISVTGTRQQLELRYNQYYILYNANLDSNHPVDVRQIKQNLNKWEASHSAFNNKTISSLFKAKSLSSKSITDKDFSVKQWKQVYRQDFKDLIQQAKENRNKVERNQKGVNDALPLPKDNDDSLTSRKLSEDTSGIDQETIPASQSSDIKLDLHASALFVAEDDDDE